MSQWCLDFDGVNDYAACGDVPTGGVSDLTVEAWVKLDASEAGGIVAKWITSTAKEWKLEVSVGGIVSFTVAYDGGKTTTATSPAALILNTWYHVAGVLDSGAGVVRLFIDGEQEDSEALSGGSAEDSLFSAYMPDNFWPVNWWPDPPPVVAVTVDNTAQPVEFGRLDSNYASLRLAWVRISDSVRYDNSFEPARYPLFIDANTLAQWDFIEGTGTSLNNRETTEIYDAVVTGATWRWDAPDRSDLWGESYERFGDRWTVLIDGEDFTDNIPLSSLEVVELIGSNKDTAVFRITDIAAADAPVMRSPVQIWHGGTLIFGGVLIARDWIVTGIYLDIVCHCVDWTELLDIRVIADRLTWTAQSAQTILKDITQLGYVPELNATRFTDAGVASVDVETDHGLVVDIVKKLAQACDFEWYVREDEEGVVYLYFTNNSQAAPFSLSTSPNLSTSFPLRIIQWSDTGSDMANNFYLVVEGEPDTGTTYTTGGTLGNVVLVDDRNVVNYSNSASVALYGFIDRTYNMTPDEIDLYTADYLIAQGEPRVSGRFYVMFPHGLRSGMEVAIEHSVLDVDGAYLIHSVRTKPLGGGAIRYEVTVSNMTTPKKSLVSALQTLRERVRLATRVDRTNWVKRA